MNSTRSCSAPAPPGEVCAGRLADGGLEVAIVEPHLVGGECSYYACMPSKALLRPGELLAEAKRVPGVAEAVTGELDAAGGARPPRRGDPRPRRLRAAALARGARASSCSAARGASTASGGSVVGDDVLVARKAVVVATGSGAAMPPIDGLDSVEAWNNREATTSKQVPESMVVLGGGPVGVELAQAWSRLGTEVDAGRGRDRLLPREEPFAGEQVADVAARGSASTCAPGPRPTAVRRRTAAASRWSSRAASEVEGERAPGRGRPQAPHRGHRARERSESRPDGCLEVDDQLRVGGSDWLYAVGDVNGRALLTHMGKYQARVAADNMLRQRGRGDRRTGIGSPRVTFTDPQVAAVGKTLPAREEAGIDARAIDVPTSARRAPASRAGDMPGHLAARRRRGPQGDRRRHLRRLRDRRLPPRGDDRDRRRGAARSPLACGPRVPHPQRGLAQAAGGLRAVSRLGTLIASACASAPRAARAGSR